MNGSGFGSLLEALYLLDMRGMSQGPTVLRPAGGVI